jgi:hypothetical protein
MPAIDPKKLKELMVTELLIPFVMRRRLSEAQLADLIRRATADERFDLSASSDRFSNDFMDKFEASFWAEELERSGKAAHLFTSLASDSPTPEERYGGVDISDLPPEVRLQIANAASEERRNAKKR